MNGTTCTVRVPCPKVSDFASWRFLWATTMALALVASACSTTSGDAPEAGAVDSPNIVLLLTDDQTVEQMRVMSEVEQLLVERGMSFINSFVNYATCCPARATLLTGQHASNHQVLWNSGDTGGYANFDGQDTTLPVALQSAGYTTIHIGKYLNGFGLPVFLGGATDLPDLTVPPGWDDFRGLISPTEVLYVEPSLLENGDVVSYDETAYVTDVVTDLVVESLEEASRGGQPFFLSVGYSAPHSQGGLPLDEVEPGTFFERIAERYPDLPFVAPIPAPRHVGVFADASLPSSAASNEADVSDKPAVLRRELLTAGELAALEAIYRAELDSLLSVDESIATIVDTLEALGELDNTYLVFTSDNGFLLGEHRLGPAKYFPYDEALRVPLVIAGPGVAAGSTVDAVVSNVDVAPTIFDLTGATALRETDGRSLMPLLTGADQDWSRAVFIEGHAPDQPLPAFNGFEAPSFVGVHAGDAVYVEYEDGSSELYDLTVDPGQLENRAGDPQHQELEQTLEGWLRVLERCQGAACRSVGER